MQGKISAGVGNTSQPQEQKSLQCIQKEIDDLKQKFKDADPNNDSIDSKDLEEEMNSLAGFIQNASNQGNKARYQKSHDLIQQRITLNKLREEAMQMKEEHIKEELKDDVESLNKILKQLEEELSFKLSIKNLTNKSLQNFLKNQLEEGQPDAKENTKNIINQLRILKEKLYQMMDDEGLETIDEDELKKQIIDYEFDLQQIDQIRRNNDYKNKQIDIQNYKIMLSLYQDIQKIIKQDSKPKPDSRPSPLPMPKDSEFIEIYDEIKYYKSIPEGCFEKILTQASYALYFKTNQISDENFEKIQEVLKDDPNNLLDEKNLDLIIINAVANLQSRYKIEQIPNSNIKSGLEKISQPIDVQNKEQLLVTKKILKNILSELRKFHLEKFFDYVNEVDKVAQTIANKDIYFLMGTTGCGKSTTIQYLCGSEMYKTMIDGIEHIAFKNVQNNELLEVSCSPYARSETRYIKKIVNTVTGEEGQTLEVILVDSPGLFDTQGIEIEVSNQYGIQKAICGSNIVRPIIILSMKKFGDKGQELKKILSFYASIIQDQSYVSEFNFFITHAQGKSIRDLVTLFQDYKNEEEAKTQNKDQGVINFLEVLLDKPKRIHIIDPLKTEDIYAIIKKLKGKISQPYKVFKQAFLPQANKCIEDQFKININEITNEFNSQQCDTKYITYKLEQLKKFIGIFNQQNYISKYDDCIFELIRILKENYLQATGIISNSLIKNNNLTSKDIELVKSSLKFANDREEIRQQFLINSKKENYSRQKIIDEFSKQIKINNPMLNQENDLLKIDSKDFINYFEKLEMLLQLDIDKIKEARDSCINLLKQKLDLKQIYFTDQIRNLETKNYTNNEQNKKFFEELATFINAILNSLQSYAATEIIKKLEEFQSKINSLLQEKFEDFEEPIKQVLNLSKNTQQDTSILRQLQLPDLQAQIDFYMDKSLIKNCKKYLEFLKTFNTALRFSQKLELYLQTEERVEKISQSLSYWVFIQEVILHKYIQDPNTQLDKISRVYSQIKDLLAENIVSYEAAQRILTIKLNLKSLVERRQNEIKDMLPQFQKVIIDKQSQVNDYTMFNLKEAVRTIKQLRWIMESDDKDCLEENINTIQEFLQILVQTIQEQVKDCRMDTEKTDDFKLIRQAFKQIDDISQTAHILQIQLENTFLDQFKPEIISSINAIELFINKKKVNSEEQKNENSYSLLERHECKRMDDYQKYLNEIRQNQSIIRSIDQQNQNLNQQKNIGDTIKILYEEMDNMIKRQPEIIEKEFKQNLKKIESYSKIIKEKFDDQTKKLSKEKLEDLFYEITEEYLYSPTNCIQKYFRLFKLLKNTYYDLWKKLGLQNNIDEEIQTQIIYMSQDYERQIMQTPNVSQDLYNKLRVLSHMKILDQFLDRPQFGESFQKCSEKINKFQFGIEKRIQDLIKEQSYNEIIQSLYQQLQMKEASSQENIEKIQRIMKRQCLQLCNHIEKGCRKYDDLDINQQKDKEELQTLNEQTKELMLMIQCEHKDLKFSNFFNDEFIRFKNAYVKIEEQRKLLQMIDIDDKQQQDWTKDLLKELQDKLLTLHAQFQNVQNPQQLMNKNPNPKQLYENLKKCCQDCPRLLEFDDAKINLMKALQTEMEKITKNIKYEIENNGHSKILQESINLLYSMPDDINEKYMQEFKKLEKQIQDNLIQECTNINEILKKTSIKDQNQIIKIIDAMKFNFQEVSGGVSEYFQNSCKQAQELLKTEFLKVIQEYIFQLYEFQKQSKINQILLGQKNPGDNQFSKLCDSISNLINSIIDMIFNQYKLSQDEQFQRKDLNNYFQNLQLLQIDDHIAKETLFQIIKFYNQDKEFLAIIKVNLIEKLNNIFTEAQNYLNNIDSEFKKALQNKPRNIIKYYGILKNLKNNDQWLIFLSDKRIQDLYSNLSEKQSYSNIQAFIKLYNLINHKNLGKQLSPYIEEAKKQFASIQLLNQQTKNSNNERVQFYSEINIHYQELNFSKDFADSIQQNTQQEFDQYDKEIKSQIQNIIDLAIQMTDKQIAADLGQYQEIKDLDIFILNINEVITTLQLDQSSIENYKKHIEKIKVDLIRKSEDCKKITMNSLIKQPNGQLNINSRLIADNLIFLQTLCNIDLIKIKCNQNISEIINKIDQIRSEMDQSNDQTLKAQYDFMFDVGNLLKQNPEGSKILQKFPQFEGIRRVLEFEKYSKQGVEYVLDNLEFHNGNQIVKVDKTQYDQLLAEYNQFNDKYMGYLNDYIGPIESVQNNLQQLKTKVYTLTRRQKDVIDKKTHDNIPEVLALLFAIFTIQDSIDVLHKIKKNGNLKNGEKYLLKPHAGQIIAIFRILGLGHPQIKIQQSLKSIFKRLSNNNQNPFKAKQIKKFIGTNNNGEHLLFDNLAQIKTGEGKSYVLGILSSLFALWGFNVNCVSYSEYLSQRDFDTFTKFFQFLDIIQHIQYNTFNTICENYLNQNGDVRKIVLQRILRNPQDQVKLIEKDNHDIINNRKGLEQRPQILLIDEVDVFFSSNFFGKMFSPTARIKCQQVTQLLDYIWSMRANQLTFSKLQTTPEYRNCQALFNPEYYKLFDASCRNMLYEVQQDPDHGYVVEKQRIGYLYNDQISFKMNYGYKTTFANYHEYEKQNILKDNYDDCKSISIQCMQFSYSEVPIQFVLTVGVTGTLSALSDSELEIVRKTFQIQNFTYIPSVYGDSNLDWEKRENRIKIRNQPFYENEIIQEIKQNLQSQEKKRAVIVFFEDETKLEMFRKHKDVNNKIAHKTLTEKLSNNEKEEIINHATYPLSVTFATPGFGRGTDFVCRDQEVELSGGLHVILTFMPTQQSEFVQIQGRTARQGNKGSFSMVLLDEDLKKFNLSLLDQGFDHYEEVKGDQWKVLQQKRDKILRKKKENELEGIAQIQKLHNKSMEIQNTIINEPRKHQLILEYLLSINKDRQFEGTPVRTLILMDATGSMTNLLEKAKNSVAIMFEKTSPILMDNFISPEMIQIQFAVYRNYSSSVKKLLQHSSWESNPQNLRNFMDSTSASGGQGNEAVEVGLQHAVYEANKANKIPLSQVFLIGDAPPNTPKEIDSRRGDENQWKGTKFETKVHWEEEANKLQNKNIPVHTFYVKDQAKVDFKKIADVTKGTCKLLDVNNQEEGQKMLISMFSTQLLKQIGDISGQQGLGEKMAQEFIKRFN